MKITMGPYTRCHSCLKPTFTFAEIWSRRFLYLNLHYHKNTQYETDFIIWASMACMTVHSVTAQDAAVNKIIKSVKRIIK